MSQHSSLRAGSRSKGHRSVFKRLERIRILTKEGRWKEGADSVYGLPKVKSIKIKVKKEKAPETAEAAAAEVQGQAAPAGAPAAAAKPTQAAPAKKGAEEAKGKAAPK